jgi:hypothetical protein
MTYAGLVNKHNNKIPNKQAALEMLRSMSGQEVVSPWYQVMLTVLKCLALSNVRGFWRLAHAAPFVLACVLFSQMNMVQQHGLALAAKAFGECVSSQMSTTTKVFVE